TNGLTAPAGPLPAPPRAARPLEPTRAGAGADRLARHLVAPRAGAGSVRLAHHLVATGAGAGAGAVRLARRLVATGAGASAVRTRWLAAASPRRSGASSAPRQASAWLEDATVRSSRSAARATKGPWPAATGLRTPGWR